LTNEQNFIQKGNIMKLDTGDIFPSLSGMTINGEIQILPQAKKNGMDSTHRIPSPLVTLLYSAVSRI